MLSGEWSNAITDCAQWLNGRGVGARWDGTWQPNQPTLGSCDGYTGNMSTFSDDYKTFLRKYVSPTCFRHIRGQELTAGRCCVFTRRAYVPM